MAKAKKVNIKLRNARGEREIFSNVWEQYLELIHELLPHSRACGMVGVDPDKFKAWIMRFPVLRTQAERRWSEGILAKHRLVASGGQGWQSAARLLESADPENYLKTSGAGRKANAVDPYSRAMGRKK